MLPKCNLLFVYGIINEFKPSVSPNIITIILNIDINGFLFIIEPLVFIKLKIILEKIPKKINANTSYPKRM